MIIANPIYDVVFKRLMENERVAKFFVGTLLNKKVKSISIRPQEFTYADEQLPLVRIFRLDFIAIVEMEDGKDKKILIEIQKAFEELDLMRFRNYLAEQYKKKDKINEDEVILPITTIYILGFNLPKIKSPCVHVQREYWDMVEDRKIAERNAFIEKLTHDSYVVQVRRISGRYQSTLDKLLSLFEQNYFLGDSEILKDFNYDVDLEEVKLMAEILHHTGADAATRKRIEAEKEAWRTIHALMGDKYKKALKKIAKKERELVKMDKELTEKDKELTEKDKKLTEKDKKLTEKDKKLTEKDKLIEELQRKLKEK